MGIIAESGSGRIVVIQREPIDKVRQRGLGDGGEDNSSVGRLHRGCYERENTIVVKGIAIPNHVVVLLKHIHHEIGPQQVEER
jgi:hypothetical protein